MRRGWREERFAEGQRRASGGTSDCTHGVSGRIRLAIGRFASDEMSAARGQIEVSAGHPDVCRIRWSVRGVKHDNLSTVYRLSAAQRHVRDAQGLVV